VGERVGAVGERVGAVGERVGAVGERVGAVGEEVHLEQQTTRRGRWLHAGRLSWRMEEK
jgi:hypothetical protein